MLVGSGVYRAGIVCATPDLAGTEEWLTRSDTFVWLGFRNPSHAEFGEVARLFELPPSCATMATEPHLHPTYTSMGTASSLILRTVKRNTSLGRLFFGEVAVFFTDRYVITARYGDASSLDPVRTRLEAESETLARGTAGVLHAIIDQIVSDYVPVLHGLEHEIIELERDVFSDEHRRSTRRIYELKKEVLDLYGLVDTLTDPLNRLIRSRETWMTDEARERLQDLDHEVNRLSNRARSISDLLTSALSAHLAQVGVRQNEDMRRISAWAAILAIPTCIAGVYGMNFASMPELNARYGYPATLLGIFTLCTLLFRWFRRNGWL